MKKDINPSRVENISVAVVQEIGELHEIIWNVYLINQKKTAIDNVLISSRGYITAINGDETKTSVLKHSIGNIKANSYKLVEPIMENVFGLHNEYWVSFFENNEMLDKKYIFLAETIKEENLINIPILNKKGVLIK